jgi:hypothetical protein
MSIRNYETAGLHIPNNFKLLVITGYWWHKTIKKNRKLYIYQIIIRSILMNGAEVWQISTREINKILST